MLDHVEEMGSEGDSDNDVDATESGAGSFGSAGGSAFVNNGAAVSTCETLLVTAGYDHTIKLWHIHTSLCVKTFQHPDSQVNALSVTPDRKLLAAAGYQHIRIYDVHGTNLGPSLNLEGLTKNITTLGFNKDGQWMYSGGEDYNARIWDLRTSSPQCQKAFQTHSSPITCAALHPSQTEIIVSDQSGTIHVWDLRNDKTRQLIPDQISPVPVQHVCVDPKGKYLAAVNNKGDCYVWSLIVCLGSDNDDPLKLSPFHRMKAHKRFALKCWFSPDSSLLTTTSADQTAKVWRVSDFTLQNDLFCTGLRWVWDAAFTGDNQYLITVSSDNLARLWSLDSGQVKREYTGHQKPITCVVFKDPTM